MLKRKNLLQEVVITQFISLMLILKIVSAFMNHQQINIFVRFVRYTKWYSKQQQTFTNWRLCGFDFPQEVDCLSFIAIFQYIIILLWI